MARIEGGNFVDRVVEKVFYPNINGITPGPLAGLKEQRKKQNPTDDSEPEIDGFAGINVLPSRNVALIALGVTAGLAVLATKSLVGKITKK